MSIDQAAFVSGGSKGTATYKDLVEEIRLLRNELRQEMLVLSARIEALDARERALEARMAAWGAGISLFAFAVPLIMTIALRLLAL